MRLIGPKGFGRLLFGAVLWGAVVDVKPGLGAETGFTPLLSVSEEFNDNVSDSAADRRSDFITRIQPGAALAFRAPRLSGDLIYSFDYHHYARGTRDDEENHYLNLRTSAELVKNFFFVDLSDTFSRISLDVARDTTVESLHANQSDRNLGSFSPYLLFRFSDTCTLKTGYSFTDTSYFDSPGIDSRENGAFAELSLARSQLLGLNARYGFKTVATDVVDYRQHDIDAGFRYQYAGNSFVYGGIGNSWQDFNGGGNASNLFWNAGISRSSGRSLATLETRVQYAADPLSVSTKETAYRFSLERELEKGAVTLSAAHVKYRNTRSDTLARHKTEGRVSLHRELLPRVTMLLRLTGDKVVGSAATGLPYHLHAGCGISYSLNEYASVGLNYSYIDYRQEFGDASGARRTNRIVLDVTAKF